MSEHQEEVESALANLRETQALYAKMEGFVKEKRQSVLGKETELRRLEQQLELKQGQPGRGGEAIHEGARDGVGSAERAEHGEWEERGVREAGERAAAPAGGGEERELEAESGVHEMEGYWRQCRPACGAVLEDQRGAAAEDREPEHLHSAAAEANRGITGEQLLHRKRPQSGHAGSERSQRTGVEAAGRHQCEIAAEVASSAPAAEFAVGRRRRGLGDG